METHIEKVREGNYHIYAKLVGGNAIFRKRIWQYKVSFRLILKHYDSFNYTQTLRNYKQIIKWLESVPTELVADDLKGHTELLVLLRNTIKEAEEHKKEKTTNESRLS